VRASRIFIFAVGGLLVGCAAETNHAGSDLGTPEPGSEQCALHRATILAPAPGAILPGTSTDVRVRWSPEPSREQVQANDATGKAYLPATSAIDTDGVHVYHFVLPASTELELMVVDQCFVVVGPNNGMRALLLDLGSVSFSTGA
jgi:hypothetical protein